MRRWFRTSLVGVLALLASSASVAGGRPVKDPRFLLERAYESKRAHNYAAAAQRFAEAKAAGADAQLVALETAYVEIAMRRLADARRHLDEAAGGSDETLAGRARAEREALPADDAHPGSEQLDEAYRRRREGKLEAAAGAFRAAREAGADPQLVALELGYVELERARPAEARAHFETAAKGPDSGLAGRASAELVALPAGASPATVALDAAYARKERGDLAGAARSFAEARELGANAQLVELELGYLDLARGKTARAKRHLTTASRGPDGELAERARAQLASLGATEARPAKP